MSVTFHKIANNTPFFGSYEWLNPLEQHFYVDDNGRVRTIRKIIITIMKLFCVSIDNYIDSKKLVDKINTDLGGSLPQVDKKVYLNVKKCLELMNATALKPAIDNLSQHINPSIQLEIAPKAQEAVVPAPVLAPVRVRKEIRVSWNALTLKAAYVRTVMARTVRELRNDDPESTKIFFDQPGQFLIEHGSDLTKETLDHFLQAAPISGEDLGFFLKATAANGYLDMDVIRMIRLGNIPAQFIQDACLLLEKNVAVEEVYLALQSELDRRKIEENELTAKEKNIRAVIHNRVLKLTDDPIEQKAMTLAYENNLGNFLIEHVDTLSKENLTNLLPKIEVNDLVRAWTKAKNAEVKEILNALIKRKIQQKRVL